MTTLLPLPMNPEAYARCVQQGTLAPDQCYYLNRFFSNGKERPGVYTCYDEWRGPEESFARKIGIREGARMYGFNPPDPKELHRRAQEVAIHLRDDPQRVYNRKPCGEEWNWYALACFFNWFWWLNPEAQAQVLADMDAGDTKWAVWAMHFQTLCPTEVRDDPVYAAWYDELFSRGPQSAPSPPVIDPSWDRQGSAPSRAVGPIPQPWPILQAAPGWPSIPMLPVTPCEPFPQCVVDQAMAVGLPMPCAPFPQCAFDMARIAAAADPTMEMTVAPDGSGTYEQASPKKSATPTWVLPALLAALGVGVLATAAVVMSPSYDL